MNINVDQLIQNAIEDINHTLVTKIPVNLPNKEIRLFGEHGLLDSIALVTFILKIEEQIEERYGINLILADEKAFSQTKSPFQTLSTLSTYVESRLNKSE